MSLSLKVKNSVEWQSKSQICGASVIHCIRPIRRCHFPTWIPLAMKNLYHNNHNGNLIFQAEMSWWFCTSYYSTSSNCSYNWWEFLKVSEPFCRSAGNSPGRTAEVYSWGMPCAIQHRSGLLAWWRCVTRTIILMTVPTSLAGWAWRLNVKFKFVSHQIWSTKL